jgi:glutaredoxin-like protein
MVVPLLDANTREQVAAELADLKNPVKIVVFTQTFECRYCAETRRLCEEISGLSDQVSVEVYNFVTDKDKTDEHGIDKIPAIAVVGAKDYGVRYFGIPSGYEFTSLLEGIKTVSAGEVELMPETVAFLDGLKEPLHIQVFVTPTCPYCPQAVVLAHHLAIASDMVTADMVEAIELPHLTQKYSVMGVPRSVVNETVHQEGAAPEPMLLERLKEATSAS